MKNTARKLFALLLCLVMVAGLFPAAALAEEGESASAEAVRVEFVCDPPETIVTVYDPADLDENGQMAVIDPEEDGTYLLLPGSYLYDAECEGYEPVEKYEFEVSSAIEPMQVIMMPLGTDIAEDEITLFDEPQTTRAETYDASSAVTYAKNHVGNYSGSNQCANFVSACLRAGGLTSIQESYAANLFNALIAQGYQSEVLNGYIKYDSYDGSSHTGFTNTVLVSNNQGKVSSGDVIFYVKYEWRNDTVFYADSNKHYLYHTVLCCGQSGNNYISYGASPYWYQQNIGSYSSGLSGGDKIALIVVHMDGATPSDPTEITFSNICVKSGSASGSAVTSVAKDQAILYGKLTYGNDNKPDYFNLYLGTKQNQLSKLQINDNTFSDTTLSNNYPTCAFWVSFKDGSTDIDTNPLVDGTTYYYQFEAVSRSGSSYFSEVKSFNTTGTAPTYTISYNANGGTGAPASQTKTYAVDLTLSGTKPTRANASAGSYTVTLNANGGSVSTTSLTAARTTSYSFKNWNTKADGSGTSYASGGSYTANAAATLYAQWNSSTSTAAVTLPTPTRTGYSFKGWATSTSATSGTTGSYTPTGNVTLYAIWQANPYTITFDANGGTGAPAAQTKLHDVALTLSTTKPSRANASAGSYTVTLNANGGSVSTTSLTAARTTSYSFKNWNTKADGSGTSYASGGSYTANAAATLYAQWNSSTSTAAVTLPTPTRTGYSFKGWATSTSATSGTTGSYTPTGNVTLYAIWQANPYTITFDANGGTGAPAAQTKLHDVALTLSTTKPSRANASAGSYTVTLNANGGSVDTTSLTAARTTSYTFNNWNTKADGSGTSYASGGSYTANAAATLYAQWNSSTATAAVTLPTPTREGFTFKGWATSDTATEGIIGSYTPTGNMTLYAIWEQNAPETNAKLVVDGGRVRVGQEIQVPVRIEENPGVVSIEISVLYDETVLEWTAVTPGEYGGTFLGEVGDSLTWYAEDPRENETKDGVFVTLSFRVKEDAAAGTTQVSVSYEEDDIYNADEENQAFQTVPGEIVIYTYIPGDINGDGSVNNKDVLRLQKYLKGQNVEVVEAALDVNGDGKVNNKDATRLARWLKYHDVEIH